MVVRYVPDRGDVVWVNLNPTRGHEQAALRPCIVLSPRSYNSKSGLALMCPITSHAKQYPFEVMVNTQKVRGVALVDQIRSIDWNARRVRYVSKAPRRALQDIEAKLTALLFE